MPSLLCCRAPRSSSPPLPNIRHVNISDEKQRELRHHVPTYSISIASSKSAEDLQAIHQIFASSSQDESGPAALAPQGPIQELHTNPGTKIHHKESNSRLHDVTTKLRKRLSRDSATSRRSSKRKSRSTTSEEDVERRRELKRALHKRLQDEILEDRRVSEGGYDPDAETIATPSISREATAGSRGSPRYLGEVLRGLESVRELERKGRRQSEPSPKADRKTQDIVRRTHSIRSVATPCRRTSKGGPGAAFGVQTLEADEDDLRTHGPANLQLPSPDQSPVWRPDLRLDCSDTARPTSVVADPLQNSISSATAPRRSDTNDSSLTIKAPAAPALPPLRLPSISGSVTVRDWRLSLTPGRGNPLSGGDNDVAREKDIEGNKTQTPKARIPLIGTSSFLGPIRSNEIVKRSTEEQKIDGDHASRCMPSAEGDEFGGIDDAREVAAAETRIVPRPRSATLPKVSRFKEDLEGEPYLDARSEKAQPIQHQLHRRHSIASYDGSDEWYASGKQQGFGYEYAPTKSDNSTVLWNGAFQQHPDGGVSSSKLRSGSDLQDSRADGLETKVQGGKAPKVNTAEIPAGTGFKTEGWSFESKPGGPAEIPEIDPKHVNRRKNIYTSSTTSRSSWGRYPSHTREERSSSPAGAADNVIARDFAPASQIALEPDGEMAPKPKSGLSMLGKKKSRSMTFGKAVMKTFSRLYRSHSTDFRPSIGNHRTSVHIGGVLEYPELEVLAPLSPIILPSEDDCQSDGVIFAPLTACKSNGSQQSIVRRSPYSRPPGIRTWSRAYDDCVILPSDTDEASMVEAPASSLYPGMASREPVVRAPSSLYSSMASKEQDLRSWRRPSSNSTANMRASTLDFQRSLQIHEVKARERALQAAEEAWGVKTLS
ncbi:MAG: hypothetical protein LQ347_002122 [Umbilicaria vellea]|nr:MAG: hypothetical protein LQ347_002122 [Umbilicaria vellea]